MPEVIFGCLSNCDHNVKEERNTAMESGLPTYSQQSSLLRRPTASAKKKYKQVTSWFDHPSLPGTEHGEHFRRFSPKTWGRSQSLRKQFGANWSWTMVIFKEENV
jgi:hypothetical protein